MSDSAEIGGDGIPRAPSMLDLIRLSPKLLFPPGGRDLYRQVALLADLSEDDEVLVVGSANGVTVHYFVTEYGVQGSGVDFDKLMVKGAANRARDEDLTGRLQYQHAPLDHLPYRDEIFDVVVGELGLTARTEPEDAVRELVRVARPGGRIVMIQLVWKAPVDEARRRVLSEHLGVRPLMLVEWKRMLREAGVEHLHIEDWTDEQTAFRPHIAKPFPDFAELFSLPEKIGILHRAWRRWSWTGVRTVLVREREVHKLLTRERILGLTLVTGVRSGAVEAAQEEGGRSGSDVSDAEGRQTGSAGGPDEAGPGSGHAGGEAGPDSEGGQGDAGFDTASTESAREAETLGLPLFGNRDENG